MMSTPTPIEFNSQPSMPDFHMMDGTAPFDLQLLPVLTGSFFRDQVNYPVIVEAWHRIKHGKVKRQWLQAFTAEERDRLARYQAAFRNWCLCAGTPLQVSCQPKTLELLKRAVAFFAALDA